MRRLIVLSLLLASTAAYAQRSAVPSQQAGNITPGSPEIANALPPPPADADSVPALLATAESALKAGHTGAAQEALEEAETRALDRSVPYNDNDKSISGPVVDNITAARTALGNKDTKGAMTAVEAAEAAAK